MFLRMLARDRRVWLVLLLSVLVVLVSRFVLSVTMAISWVVLGGYWVLLLVVALFGRALWRIRSGWPKPPFSRTNIAAACLVLVSGSLLLSHEKYGFKILADEVLLLGTSMDIHYDRQVAYPVRATDIQGPFQILQRVLDKRPFFYPFLVSLAHDLTGYRPANAFYVNTALGFVFLALAFILGRQLGGTPWAGALAVLLFAGLPLLAQQMKGGGFDLLNLVMLLSLTLLALRFATIRDERTQEAFVFAAVLLAFTRYESVLMLPAVTALILWGWWRERRVILTWPVIVAPLFLMFCLLQNRVFDINTAAWELGSKPEAGHAFGFGYVAENLGHALAFFLDTTGYQPNSPFFGAVGLLAVPFFAIWMVRALRGRTRDTARDTAVAVMGLGLLAIWALLMAYFWGQFDHPVIRRLSLPVHLLMAMSVIVVFASICRNRRGWQAACAAAVVALVVYSLPAMARRAYASTYSPAVEMEWRTEFLQRFPERDYLFIDNDSTFWISNHVPATPALQARERKPGLIYHLRNESFSAMYVMQHYHVDAETGKRTLEPADDIGPDYELEPVWERRIQTLFIGRISRITAISDQGVTAARAGLAVRIPAASLPQAEADAAKKAFVDKWLKQLP